MKLLTIVLGLVAALAAGQGQVTAPGKALVSMGHLHLNSSNPAAQKKFWVEVLGAKPATVGPLEVFLIPGAIIFVNSTAPSAGTDGSVVNHIGVKVRDLKGTEARAVAAGIKVLSSNDKQVMLMGPDELKTELTGDGQMDTAVANHHIHFYVPDPVAAQKWYADTFGAIPGKRAAFDAADLPGVNLTFSKSESALPGTKGRALDHIGFEVKDLEAFVKHLEQNGVHFDRPYRKIPQLGLAVAFFTDPWGTYIELTEGLNRIQ